MERYHLHLSRSLHQARQILLDIHGRPKEMADRAKSQLFEQETDIALVRIAVLSVLHSAVEHLFIADIIAAIL